MGYSREVCKRAADELSRRRQAAEREAIALKARVVKKFPQALDCENRVAAAVGRIAFAVLNNRNVDEAIAAAEKESAAAKKELAGYISAAGEKGKDFSPIYTCQKCSDTGLCNNHICDCHQALLTQYSSEELSKISGMKLVSFDDIDLSYYNEKSRARMAENFQFCRDYAEHFDTSVDSLLLYGSTGTGKTHAALAIAEAATEKGFSVIYGPVQMLMRKLEKEHFGHEEGDSEEKLLSCDLLILDDLGTEMSTSFSTAYLYNIINSRLLAGLPTIISTNCATADLVPRYGDAIASRILGTFELLCFEANDVRQAKLERRLAGEI